jgi:4-hydroxybenzoate polyprenyltransferase
MRIEAVVCGGGGFDTTGCDEVSDKVSDRGCDEGWDRNLEERGEDKLTTAIRTFLVLGRVSNLPTVWSNCLAGWWLGGGGNLEKLPFLFIGTTLLYVGGMFLNDAFDAEFDRQHRKERPIPSGRIALDSVWRLGWAGLALGAVCLLWPGQVTGGLGLLLVFCIILYDAIHKLITFSPVLMGICRFFLYVIAASTGQNGVTGWSIWCGLALLGYIVGLSYLARRESTRGPLSYWPLLVLAAPIFLAFLMNVDSARQPVFLLSAVVVLWVLRCLRSVLWSPQPNVGRTVSGLLAGIVLVDWLAVPDVNRSFGMVFIGLFLAALLFQRFVPAT